MTNTATEATAAPLVDWPFAAAAASRMAPPGPKAARNEVVQLVSELRAAAQQAVGPVAETSSLTVSGPIPPALVVDRPGWIRANTATMEALLTPILTDTLARRPSAAKAGETTRKVAARIGGGEVAGILAWVSTKVLGQYDLAPQAEPRLMFVAPNVLAAERELEVDPSDFRLWVAMHEETHRAQFTAVPWLREHLLAQIQAVGGVLVPQSRGEAGDRARSELPGKLLAVARGQLDITELLGDAEQREQLAQVTAVMSLLEGHADVVMDEVGPSVITSVADIRERFNARRRGASQLDRVLRRLLGMEAKMRQYRDGAAFVRTVTEAVGWDGFNQVWSGPAALPAAAEILAPNDWLARVRP